MKLYFPLYCLHPFVTGCCSGTIKNKVVIADQKCSYEVSGFHWRLFLSLSNNGCLDEINELLNSVLSDNSCSYQQLLLAISDKLCHNRHRMVALMGAPL